MKHPVFFKTKESPALNEETLQPFPQKERTVWMAFAPKNNVCHNRNYLQ